MQRYVPQLLLSVSTVSVVGVAITVAATDPSSPSISCECENNAIIEYGPGSMATVSGSGSGGSWGTTCLTTNPPQCPANSFNYSLSAQTPLSPCGGAAFDTGTGNANSTCSISCGGNAYANTFSFTEAEGYGDATGVTANLFRQVAHSAETEWNPDECCCSDGPGCDMCASNSSNGSVTVTVDFSLCEPTHVVITRQAVLQSNCDYGTLTVTWSVGGEGDTHLIETSGRHHSASRVLLPAGNYQLSVTFSYTSSQGSYADCIDPHDFNDCVRQDLAMVKVSV